MKPITALPLLLASAALAQTPPQYRVELLPRIDHPWGPMNVGGGAMNDHGHIIGVYFLSSPNDPYRTRVAYYTPSQGWQDIGHPGNLESVLPADINNAGLLIGKAAVESVEANSYAHAWSWQNGQFTLYPQFEPPRVTAPVYTNEAGDLYGFGNTGMIYRAVRFAPGSITDILPGVPGGSMAYDVNNNGVLLGSDVQGIFFWEPNQPRWYMPAPSSLPYVEINALNDRKDAVGMARAEGHTETRTAVVWLDGAGWTLLPRNARRCNAKMINNLREVVGTSQDNAGAIGNHAWYWRPGMSTITPLEYLITDPPSTYAVNGVSDINENGQILAGVSVRATGEGFTAILTPIITAPLQLDLVSNTPPALHPPGVPMQVDLRILSGTAQYTPGTAQVHYRATPAASFTTLPLTLASGNTYTAPLPAFACADQPQFYFTAQADGGATVSLPANAPTSLFSAQIGANTTTVALDESFNAGLPPGWTTSGLWTNTSACNTPGVSCYDGGPPWMYYGIPAQCNIDSGGWNSGSLTAPAITLPTVAPGGEIRLTYCSSCVWDIIGGSATAQLLVNGVERDDPDWGWGWQRRSVNLTQYAGQTVSLEWRFDSGGIFGLQERGWHIDNVRITATSTGCNQPTPCYANCDNSTAQPVLNVADFTCFLQRFAAGESYANCDQSTTQPALNVADFTCFLQRFAQGCP